MAHQEACQLYIEQQIKEGLEEGKTPYSIGKDLSAWVEKLFETSIPADTLKKRAQRMAEKELGTNVPILTTSPNPCRIQDNQVAEHGGVREGAGRPAKFQKPAEPWSCAMQMVGMAICNLERIPQDDPQRQSAFQKLLDWIDENI